MGINLSIDITDGQRQTVLTLLERHLPGTEAWVYGSRAKWTSRPQSDLDLVVFATPEQSGQIATLREAFEESDLPFRVDLFVWDEVSEQFKKDIEEDYVIVLNEGQAMVKNPRRALKELVDIRLSSVDKKTITDERKVRLCNYTDVYYNNYIFSNMNFMEATATEREIEKCALQLNDVVITKDSEKHDDIGVPALVREEIENLVCGYHLAILRPMNCIYGPYLYYALLSKPTQYQFHSYANGITRFGLRKADIGLVEVTAPSFSEQRAIAQILGTLDDKIELNRRMNETLEAMARALFQSWFVDFDPVRAKMEGRDTGLPRHIADLFPDRLVDSELGEIPEGWQVRALPDLVEVNPVRRLRKGQAAPYLDMANMPVKGHIPDTVVARSFGSGMRFVNGDTLVARITPCLENGKTAYVDFLGKGEIGWGSTEYIVLRAKSPLPHEFAYCLARSVHFRDFAIQSMTGTSGRQRVQPQALQQFPLAGPTEDVALAFGNLIRPLISKASAAAKESRSLAGLRDALLPKLVSGELRTGNAVSREARMDRAVQPN